MKLKCAHCGAELVVHRNLALHPDEGGCQGVPKSDKAINLAKNHIEAKKARALADAAIAWCGSGTNSIAEVAARWGHGGWRVVADAHYPAKGMADDANAREAAVEILRQEGR